MELTHVLITRFNVEYLEKIKSNFDISVEEWLEKRFLLFFTYCYPSVVQQTEGNFSWLVYFDHRTPKEFIIRIMEKDTAKIIRPVFAETWKNISQNIRRDISQLDLQPKDLLISSRLDNDDALSKEYIVTIQNLVRANYQSDSQLPFSIDLPKGIVYSYDKGLLYNVTRSSNPFISLVTQYKGDMEIVFDYQHQVITSRFRTISFMGKALWLQNIHETNISNKIYGKLKLLGYEKMLREFGIESRFRIESIGPRIFMKSTEMLRLLHRKVKKNCFPSL